MPKGFKKENYTLLHTCKNHKKYQIDFFSIDNRMDDLKDGLYGWTAPKMKPFRLLAPQDIRKRVLAILITNSSTGVFLKDLEDNLEINLDNAYYSIGTEKDYYIDNSSDIETQQGTEENEESEDHWDVKGTDLNETKCVTDTESSKKSPVKTHKTVVIRLNQPDQKALSSNKTIKSATSQVNQIPTDNSMKKSEKDSVLESNTKGAKKRTHNDYQNANLEQQIDYLKEDNTNLKIKIMEIEEKLQLERQNSTKLEIQICDDRILISQLGEVVNYIIRDQNLGKNVKEMFSIFTQKLYKKSK